jgi:hypothetical protein
MQKSACLIAKASPGLLELPEVVRAFEQSSIHLMVRCLTEGTKLTMSAGAQRHEVIVKRLRIPRSKSQHAIIFGRDLRGCRRSRTHIACCLRRPSWYRTDPLSRIAENASRPPHAVAG